MRYLVRIRPDRVIERWARNEEVTKLEDLQALVGGYIETVPCFADGHCMIVNEEGKLKGLELNVLATQLSFPDFIVGDAVIARVCGDDIITLTEEDACRVVSAFEKLHAKVNNSV